jgi:hypothetical protein
MAAHSSNTIFKFADGQMVIGLITDDDEPACKQEVSDLAMWCQEYGLSLNIGKTKKLFMRAVVERVENFNFLFVHITKELTWFRHTHTVVKTAQQRLLPLRRLK